MSELGRRSFVASAAGAALGSALAAQAQSFSIPIVDCHIHLFDQTAAAGRAVLRRGRTDNEPALPARYRKLALPLGVNAQLLGEHTRTKSLVSSNVDTSEEKDLKPPCPLLQHQLSAIRV